MSVYFDRPLGPSARQSKFSSREVGLTHPDLEAYIKIADNGDIQIMASPDLGIILSPSKGTIFFVGNSIKFATNEIKWNENRLNPYATKFTEAMLIPPNEAASMYDNMSDLTSE